MRKSNGRRNRWGVILAGGEGNRLRPFVENIWGEHRPKQYCAFNGERTMIEHAVDRALGVADPGRIVTIVGRGHGQYLAAPRPIHIPGRILEQPEMRGTGPGVLLPLAYILSQDPDAVVAVLPSDHFIRPRERFIVRLREACRLAELLPRQMIVLAARPDRPETDYGWIRPGFGFPQGGIFLVDRFVEKPGVLEAEEFYRRGYLWNTMIIVARAAALWSITRDIEPDIVNRFEDIRCRMGSQGETDILAGAYRSMRMMNFSRDILARAVDWSVVLALDGIEWCDWGRAERILEYGNREMQGVNIS